MTTDTAFRTTKKIIETKVPFDELTFVDRPEISATVNEKLILNFRFLADENNLPIMAQGIKEMLLESDDFDLENLE